MKEFFTSRKFRQGSVSTVITVLVVAIVVVLNMVVSALTDRYSLSLDLTPGKVFGISPATTQYLNNLSRDVDIYVLNSEQNFAGGSTYYRQVSEVLQRYSNESPMVTLTYVDLTRNPTFASRFPEMDLAVNSILVSSGSKAEVLSVYDLFDIDYSNYYGEIVASKAEQAMTSAIAQVASDTVVTVAVLSGHNEGTLTGLTERLALNNYNLVDVNILTEEIPPEATLAILSVPQRDYTEDELKKLDRYLYNDGAYGKSLFYMAGVDQSAMPNLEAFLAEWNIQVDSGIVFESNLSYVLNLDYYMPLVGYAENDYSSALQSKRLNVAMPYSRPLGALNMSANRTVTTLLQFSESAGIQSLDAEEDWQEDVGPVPALLLSKESQYVDGQEHASYVLVSGSSLAVEESFLASSVIGNSEYFLTVLRRLSQGDETVLIQSKQMGSAQLGLNGMNILVLGLLLILVLPLGVLVAGLVVFFRRRHL